MPAFASPSLPSTDRRWKIVKATMREHDFPRHALIETLHTLQSSLGFLDDVAMHQACASIEKTAANFRIDHTRNDANR
jgi:bidirectional [NiFe] hydrogenase diaphorase subunit